MRRARFPWRLFSRIVLVQSALVVLALGTSGLIARHFFKQQFTAQVERQLRSTLSILASEVDANTDISWCARRMSGADVRDVRLTLVRPEGKVYCDSHHEPQSMDNHASRPEVAAALDGRFVANARPSATLGQEMLYGAAVSTDRAMVVRGAIPLDTLNDALRVLDASLSVFLVLIALILSGFAVWSARSLVFPIGRLLVKAQNVLAANERLNESAEADQAFGELSDLEDSLDSIRKDLEAKAERLNLQHEEQATLMSAISDSILAVDKEGAPLFYNSKFMLLFGRQGLLDRNFRLWEIFRDPEILEAFKEALAQGRTAAVKGFPVDMEDGRKYFSLSVSPLRRGAGEVYGAVGIFHDVTDLKRAEQIRIDFVANVSHELRTPLTAIKGYADTLKLDLDSGRPAEREFVEIIRRNSERLMSLITDLLDLSSLESNVEDLHKAVLDTAEVSQRVVAQLKGAILEKGQSVEIDARNAPQVLADARRLEQVLTNLLDNARKYTPAGGRLGVRWEQGAKPGEVALRIWDTGPGISPQHHERLFERFYRVDKARSRELGGTGLGLAIVKHIMQRHGGSVSVESEMGRGSTFTCRFPGEA